MKDVISLPRKELIEPRAAEEKNPADVEKKEMAALVSWEAPEYDYISKSKDWYWAVGILSAALIIVAILLKNFLFAIFIALAGFSIALYGARRPKIVRFSITARGVQIADRFFPYEALKSFWINYDPPHKKELDVISKKMFMPRLTLPLGDTDPNKIREILARVLREEEIQESLSEIVARRLGF